MPAARAPIAIPGLLKVYYHKDLPVLGKSFNIMQPLKRTCGGRARETVSGQQ